MDVARLTKRMLIASPASDSVRITARVDDQRWDVALKAMLNANGLDAVEDSNGVILIKTVAEFAADEEKLPIATRIVITLQRPAAVVAQLARRRLSAVGVIDIDSLNNSLIVTERVSRLDDILVFIRQLDLLPPPKKPDP